MAILIRVHSLCRIPGGVQARPILARLNEYLMGYYNIRADPEGQATAEGRRIKEFNRSSQQENDHARRIGSGCAAWTRYILSVLNDGKPPT